MPRTMICPFFRYYKGIRIWCEAGMIEFPDRSLWDSYTKKFCCGNWENCDFARELEKKQEV